MLSTIHQATAATYTTENITIPIKPSEKFFCYTMPTQVCLCVTAISVAGVLSTTLMRRKTEVLSRNHSWSPKSIPGVPACKWIPNSDNSKWIFISYIREWDLIYSLLLRSEFQRVLDDEDARGVFELSLLCGATGGICNIRLFWIQW